MRIIRFLDNDGRIWRGRENGDGSASVLFDPQGVFGPAVAGRSAEGKRELLRGRRALVADDDEKMCDLMATVLRSVGCECTVCGDGAAALRAIEGEPLDLIVSDIVMPHRNGYEIFAAAKQLRADLPVVLVTGFGYDPTHSLVRATKEGLAAVLYKPFTPQELIDEVDKAIRVATADPAGALVPTGESRTVARLLAPLLPTNVICIGRNYPGAAPGEQAEPPASPGELEVFLKPSTAVQASGGPIRIPDCGATDPLVDVEGELAVIIGQQARQVDEIDALRYVLGYTAANDVTARLWQTRTGPPLWMRGKGFDTFCPLGPAVVTATDLPDPGDLALRTVVNGVAVRHGTTADMIRSVPALISALSRHLTLEPGTVILTGAPPLAHPAEEERRHLRPGDEVAVEIEGIGRLVNHVETAAGAS